jgi:hypothetical protein
MTEEIKKIKVYNLSGFEIGDEVYVILGPDNVNSAVISNFRCNLFVDKFDAEGNFDINAEGSLAIHIDRVRLSDMDIYNSDYFEDFKQDDFIRFDYITQYRERALELAKWYPVSVGKDVWKAMIGEGRDIFAFSKDCELQRTCNSMAQLIIFLRKCQDKGGLVGLEVEWIKSIIRNYPRDYYDDFRKINTRKVFDLLGVTV